MQMLEFEQLVLGAYRVKASDIHLAPDNPPVLRVNGDLRRANGAAPTGEEIEAIIAEILPKRLKERLRELRGASFSCHLKDIGRLRCAAYHVNGQLALTMRVIPLEIPTLDQLGLPGVLKEIAALRRGMALVTGAAGCGKSTTLAAMINHLNTTEARRALTLEDPIEFRAPSKRCLITQREVGSDVPDFAEGLRQALRMDPDVILVGEMRDAETIRMALKAAETGHSVFSTLHTTSVVETLERIVGYFQGAEREAARHELALNLAACVAQRLVKAVGGRSRRAALEIVRVNATVAKLIRENCFADIFLAARSREDGMQTMDQALADLVAEKAVAFEEASAHCEDLHAFRRCVQDREATGETGAILSA